MHLNREGGRALLHGGRDRRRALRPRPPDPLAGGRVAWGALVYERRQRSLRRRDAGPAGAERSSAARPGLGHRRAVVASIINFRAAYVRASHHPPPSSWSGWLAARPARLSSLAFKCLCSAAEQNPRHPPPPPWPAGPAAPGRPSGAASAASGLQSRRSGRRWCFSAAGYPERTVDRG